MKRVLFQKKTSCGTTPLENRKKLKLEIIFCFTDINLSLRVQSSDVQCSFRQS
jgi:hypothetical protein